MTGANSAANEEDQAGFAFFFAAPGIDLSDGTVTWRVMALENNDNLMVQPYAQNGMGNGYAGTYPAQQALSAASFPPGEWVDVTLDLSVLPAAPVADAGAGDAGADAAPPAPSGVFDKAAIEQLGLNVGAGAANVGTTTAMVAIDSVTFTGSSGQADVTFTTGVDGLSLNMYQIPPGTVGPTHHP